MAKRNLNSLLIDSVMNPNDYNKWNSFLEDIDMRGQTFGDAEVQRALNAGYSTNDVNDYLKWSGITPKGNFAVAGYNESQVMSGSGDGARFSTAKNPYYRFIGAATAQPAPAPDPAAYNPGAPKGYTPTTAVPDNFDPSSMQIKIPESDPMIAQLQQNLTNAVRPPDTSQLTNQLAGIKNSVQQAPSLLINPPSLGQGVSLDSFSKIYQAEVANTQGTPSGLGINTNVDGLMRGYAGQLGGAQGMLGKSPTDASVPSVEQGYNQQLKDLQSQFAKLTAMQNQAGWRAKAAMQIGSQSADSVQTASMSGATGTDKLNRNNRRNSNYLNNLTISGAYR